MGVLSSEFFNAFTFASHLTDVLVQLSNENSSLFCNLPSFDFHVLTKHVHLNLQKFNAQDVALFDRGLHVGYLASSDLKFTD